MRTRVTELPGIERGGGPARVIGSRSADDERSDPAEVCEPAGQGAGAIGGIAPAGEPVAVPMAEAEASVDRLATLRTPA
ncbi:MAG: hypothetical protein R2726_22860 [Acidimicrobiales bacterium]